MCLTVLEEAAEMLATGASSGPRNHRLRRMGKEYVSLFLPFLNLSPTPHLSLWALAEESCEDEVRILIFHGWV